MSRELFLRLNSGVALCSRPVPGASLCGWAVSRSHFGMFDRVTRELIEGRAGQAAKANHGGRRCHQACPRGGQDVLCAAHVSPHPAATAFAALVEMAGRRRGEHAHTPVGCVLADTEFDSERNHTFLRQQLHALSIIPPKRGKKTWTIHGVRAQMRHDFPSRK
jgi:hypothetical protein